MWVTGHKSALHEQEGVLRASSSLICTKSDCFACYVRAAGAAVDASVVNGWWGGGPDARAGRGEREASGAVQAQTEVSDAAPAQVEVGACVSARFLSVAACHVVPHSRQRLSDRAVVSCGPEATVHSLLYKATCNMLVAASSRAVLC